MIFNLQANVPMLIGHYDGVVSVYVRQYGAGNLRLGSNFDALLNTSPINQAPGQVVDGIPQAAADGVKQYFWSGDLFVISDVAGPVMIIAPAYQFLVDRNQGTRQPPADITIELEGGNLSTYSQ
jgi:hypothetical protein